MPAKRALIRTRTASLERYRTYRVAQKGHDGQADNISSSYLYRTQFSGQPGAIGPYRSIELLIRYSDLTLLLSLNDQD